MSVKHYKNGQLTLIAGSGGGGGEESFTGTKAEVEQAIAAGEIKENWTVYITDDIEEVVGGASGNCGCKIEYVTQEQYDALPEDKLTNDIEYRITDNNPTTPEAKNMAYDNSKSGIEAVNVQDAIDAVASENLNNLRLYPDFSKLEKIMSKDNGVTSYTLQKDCFVRVTFNFNARAGASLLVNNIGIIGFTVPEGMVAFPPFICKKGDVLSINIWDGTPYDWIVEILDVK